MVNDRPCLLREGIPNHRHSVTSHLMAHVYLRFDTAADDVNSPGGADQSVCWGIPEDDGFDRLQGLVGLDRRKDGFSQVFVDLSRMSGGADKSVIEHVACTGRVIGVALSRQGITYFAIALGRWDWLRSR